MFYHIIVQYAVLFYSIYNIILYYIVLYYTRCVIFYKLTFNFFIFWYCIILVLYYILSYYSIIYFTLSCYNILHYLIWYAIISYYVEFFMLSKVASSIILPAKTEPTWTLSEPVIMTLCLQMGEGRAGLLSRTSHHEQDLHQTQNCFRAFQNSFSRPSVSNWGGTSRFF